MLLKIMLALMSLFLSENVQQVKKKTKEIKIINRDLEDNNILKSYDYKVELDLLKLSLL